MDNSTKRLFEVVIDDLDEVLSQAMDKHEREAFSNDGLDEILSQSLDMFEEVKNSVEDAIDVTDMFEFGGPSLVMARRFATKKGEEIYIFDHFYVLNCTRSKRERSTVKGNSNSALTSALEIPSSSGTLVLNVCGRNCNITINNN